MLQSFIRGVFGGSIATWIAVKSSQDDKFGSSIKSLSVKTHSDISLPIPISISHKGSYIDHIKWRWNDTVDFLSRRALP